MVLTPSAMVPLGTRAPDFALPDTEGNTVRRSDFDGQPLLVMFICNHCPYVKHIADPLAEVTDAIHERGVAVVGINSNDVENYPDDAPPHMVTEKRRRGYAFPYLFDETQSVARAYDAKCTPDFFLYDAQHRLYYRGQFDAARPGNDEPVTGRDLLAAVAALLDGREVPEQVPSMGCNIKWKA
jgi:peroxiredoxin